MRPVVRVAVTCLFLCIAAFGAPGKVLADGEYPRPEGCEEEYPDECYESGLEAELAGDFDTALAHYRWSCNAGAQLGCVDLMHVSETWTYEETAVAFEEAVDACSAGEPAACWEASLYSTRYWTLGAGPVGAIEVWQLECDGGFGASCHALSHFLDYTDTPIAERYDRRVELAYQACELRWLPGCYELLATELVATEHRGIWGAVLDDLDLLCEWGHRESCAYRWHTIYERDRSRQATAEHELRTMCESGDALGCVYLGRIWTRDQDTEEAGILLLRDVCSAGFMRGCEEMINAVGGGRNPSRTDVLVEALEFACDAGNTDACLQWIDLQQDSRTDAYDLRSATELAETVCQEQSVDACITWARLVYENRTRARRLDEVELILTELLPTRHTGVAYELASFYHETERSAPDPGELAEFLELACYAGHAESCEEAIQRVPEQRPLDEAERLFRVACNIEVPEGCGALAEVILEQDRVIEGILALEEACDVGHHPSCSHLRERFRDFRILRLDDPRHVATIEAIDGRWEIDTEYSARLNPGLEPERFDEVQVQYAFASDGEIEMSVESEGETQTITGVYRLFLSNATQYGITWAGMIAVFEDPNGLPIYIVYEVGHGQAIYDRTHLFLFPAEQSEGILGIPLIFRRFVPPPPEDPPPGEDERERDGGGRFRGPQTACR